ncbi:MAG: hypothetical protein R3C97_06925 [Geminicoccaceae bacterium]
MGHGIEPANLAHKDEEIACFACHTSWTTSCGGCHLPIEANWKTSRHHYEGGETRNFATYNPQVARDQMFQLGKHDSTKKGIIAPVRSSSALVLSSTNVNRERIYAAAAHCGLRLFEPGLRASTSRTPRARPRPRPAPTVTSRGQRQQRDHGAIAPARDQFRQFRRLQRLCRRGGRPRPSTSPNGTSRRRWSAATCTATPILTIRAKHQANGKEIQWLGEPGGFVTSTQSGGPTGCLQLRGEYLMAAQGPKGTTAYDVASIANKGVADRILAGPVSPLGQNLHIASANATCVALPTNQNIQPTRNQGELMRVTNEEQPFHPIYDYAFITDSEGADPHRCRHAGELRAARQLLTPGAHTWNEGGILNGARHITIAGHYFYIAADAGIVVLNMDEPLKPVVETVIELADVRATAVQFRYLFAATGRGLEIVDVTHPDRPKAVEGAVIPLADARRVYVARTYAYVAAGSDGLAIIDVERPEQPALHMKFTADGQLNDARDVVVGTTNASLFAYVADGMNGLKVVQLTSPDLQANFYGFSPTPNPELVAWKKTEWPATSLSKGLDRDRAVDETGHQMAIFGRLGSRPFNLEEQRAFYLDDLGDPWFVSDEVRNEDRRDRDTQALVK